jgi:hypothetical protein
MGPHDSPNRARVHSVQLASMVLSPYSGKQRVNERKNGVL